MNRRKLLLEAMTGLENKNITCRDCTGKCCTFNANSMRMTALETEDLYNYLISNSLWTDALKEKLKACIVEYRLDVEIPTKGGTSFRRTYTCPFFKQESFGCPLPPEVKPYGCLAFNAIGSGVKDGENCASDLDLLKDRESSQEESENSELKEKHGYYWDKLPIPMALLERDKINI
jgi:hypothetical protein